MLFSFCINNRKTEKTMKKVLKPFMIAALALPTFAFANAPQTTSVEKVQQAIGPTYNSSTSWY